MSVGVDLNPWRENSYTSAHDPGAAMAHELISLKVSCNRSKGIRVSNSNSNQSSKFRPTEIFMCHYGDFDVTITNVTNRTNAFVSQSYPRDFRDVYSFNDFIG
jgi:hypothetical protein